MLAGVRLFNEVTEFEEGVRLTFMAGLVLREGGGGGGRPDGIGRSVSTE